MHDMQMMVDGEAAAALGELRARALATRHRPGAAGRPGPGHEPAADLWPETTRPRHARRADRHRAHDARELDGTPAVHEIATLTLESIAAARRFIYIENQYLTSAAIGAALARRLAEPDGPEVVLVLPREEHGWLEQSSMGVMRARVLRHLLDSRPSRPPAPASSHGPRARAAAAA